MKRPTNANVEELIVVCLDAFESDGPGAVDRILSQHPDSSALVRERLDLLGRLGLMGAAPEAATPETIGPFTISGTLGRGGMGVVYEAQQQTPHRTVALKVLRSMPGADSRERLAHEAESLARLQHPAIAQVFEVGSAVVGGLTVPYFAMELVRGVPLDQYVKEHELDRRARLELVAQIADAIHHAHQKGVIHRDLKPANILVDERGAPRVLDFGIARITDPDLQLESLRTELGQLVGTLGYMSPEQAAGDPEQIDSRTDVYSLGVVLFELLAGTLPVQVRGRPMIQVLQEIGTATPPPLSHFDRSLRGDLETITATALAKEKERRYASAHELASDLRRYLSNQPITARPPTAVYLLSKFARRHRALVVASLLLVLTLALGLAGTLSGMLRANRQRDDAERRFDQANAVLEFQKHMFATADPDQRGVQVEQMLDRAADQFAASRENRLHRASIALMLGEAYQGLGAYEKADPLIAQAVDAFEAELGPDNLQALFARTRLATLYGHPMMRLDEAEEVLSGVEARARRAHGPDHDVVLSAQLTEATLHFERGHYAESVRLARDVLNKIDPSRPHWVRAKKRLAKALKGAGAKNEAIDVAREVYSWNVEQHGLDHRATWGAMDTLGNLLLHDGRLAEGLEIAGELYEQRERHLGAEHPDTLNALANLATGHFRKGDYARAEPLMQAALAGVEQHFPLEHPERLALLNNLGAVYMATNRSVRAEPILREAVRRTVELRGVDHNDSLVAMGSLATTLLNVGRPAEAEDLYLETLDLRREVSGYDDADTLILTFNVGSFYLRTGQYERADEYYREAVETGRHALGEESFMVGVFMRGLGSNLIYLQRYAEAEDVLTEARAWLERTVPDFAQAPEYVTILRQLERLYKGWGRPEQAEPFTKLLSVGQ